MHKILIVDDNENNRLLLRAVLEDYAEENGEAFDIHEAHNGLEAVMICEVEPYDIIFMDIMMPEMDGIEATFRIRSANAKSLIVAVSAVDDSERQKEILLNGAEDYISKPINADIFYARVANYVSLVKSRHKQQTRKFNAEAVNHFTVEIYNRKLLFYIENDDALAEFWEYYLLEQHYGSDELSDAVRGIYAVGGVGIKLKLKMQIIVEESDKNLYLTIAGLAGVDSKIVQLIMLKNPGIKSYKFEEEKLSICIDKPVKQAVKMTLEEMEVPVVLAPIEYKAENKPIQVFDYMDDEDLEDLKGYIASLGTLMLVVGSGEIEAEEVQEIAANIDRIGRVAITYTESYAIGSALNELSSLIGSHIQEFQQKSQAIAPLCSAFSRDLAGWLNLVFVEGTTSVDYMDQTIISNAQMIGSFMKNDAENAEDAGNLDDIFDF